MPRRATSPDPAPDGQVPTTDERAEGTPPEKATEATPPEDKPPEVKPTLVLFVRHGKTPTTGTKLPGRASGLHLSPEGVKRAAAAARRIGRLKSVAAVYASPLERTQETAAPIAEAVGHPTVVEDGLLECE